MSKISFGPTIVIKNLTAWILSALMLIPMLLIVFTSLKPDSEARSLSLSLPKNWTLENYSTVVDQGKLLTGFWNSVLYSVCSTVLVIFLASMAAYVFSRRRSRGNKFLYMFVVMGLVLPINYVALMNVMQFLKLNNSQLGIILLYSAIQLPFMVFLIYSYVARIPIELDEAAIIDGCGPIRLFFRIILPLMKPVLVTAAVLCFLNVWNEFVLPLYFLNSSDKWPMTLSVYNFFGQFQTKWNLVAADVVLTSLPVVIMFIALQKQIIGGQTMGAVKG